jgi:hypothetical protein
MADVVVCAKGGKPLYITDNIEALTGYNAQEAAVLPLVFVSPHLAIAQNTFKQELERSRGRPFHSYTYRSVLRCKNGSAVETDNTVCIIRTNGNGDCLIVSVIRPACCSLLREIMELWPRLSEASARLVLRIVKSLAHYAV